MCRCVAVIRAAAAAAAAAAAVARTGVFLLVHVIHGTLLLHAVSSSTGSSCFSVFHVSSHGSFFSFFSRF